MMDFKDLNEALVEVLKIDPSSKKARKYKDYSTHGDKVTFSLYDGRKITYSQGRIDGDFFVSDVKTSLSRESTRLPDTSDMVRRIKKEYWKYGGPLELQGKDVSKYNTKELLDLLQSETKLGLRDEKIAKEIELRLKEIQKISNKNREIKKKIESKNKTSEAKQVNKAMIKMSKQMVKTDNIYKEVYNSFDNTMKSMQKGIGYSGTNEYTPIDSGYADVSEDFARAVRQSEKIINKKVKGKRGTEYFNKKNNYTAAGVAKMRKAYYDFETIGDVGTESFAPVQLSVLRKNKDGTEDIQSAIYQLGGVQLEYIKNALANLKHNVALSESEKRSLLAMTGYTLDKDNNVFAKHIEHSSKVDLSKDNVELLKQIEEGIEILSNAEGKVKGLVSYESVRNHIQNTFKKIADNDEYAVAHNGDRFDVDAAKVYGANMDKLKRLDTLEFIKNNFKIGYQNKSNNHRLFAYSQKNLADFFGIDLKALSKESGLSLHTAELDIKLNQKILEAAISELKKMDPKEELKDFEVKANQVGVAQKTRIKRNAYSFKTDKDDRLKTKNNGGDLLFQSGHSYQYIGVLEKEIDNVLRRFAKYQDVETGDFTYSYMDTKTSHVDEMADIFDGIFKDVSNVGEIGARDAILSMFKSTSGYNNLMAFKKGGTSSVQNQRFKNLKNSTAYSGSSELLNYIMNYIMKNDDAKKIVGTSQLGNALMGAIGTRMGIKQNHIYSLSDLKKTIGIDSNGLSVGQIKNKFVKFIENNSNNFINKNFSKEAISEIKAMDITEEDINSLDGSSLVHGFSKWLFDNLTPKYKQSTEASLGNFMNFVNSKDHSKLNRILDDEIKIFKEHFSNNGNEISNIFKNGDGIIKNSTSSLKDKFTGQDTKERLIKMGVNPSKVGINLGKYNESKNTDILKFDKNSLGGLLANFRKRSKDSNIGSHIALTPDGKSLRVGVFNGSKYKDVFDKDHNPLWEAMQGVVDIGLGDNDLLTMNGMDYINYLMPFLNDTDQIEIGTAREYLAKRLLNSVFSDRNIERLSNGESIQGSLDYFAKEVMQTASSGGTYKNANSSFYDEAIDAIRAGSTPEQKAVRGSAMTLSWLFENIAKKSGYDLGTGYTKSENLKDLMMYVTAMSLDTDGHNFVEAMELENNKGLFINSDATARSNFKSYIKRLTDAGEFSLEGLKSQSFLTQITNYIGSRDITPMSFLNSGQGRNTDQFFNYLGRKRDKEITKNGKTQRQEGFEAGLLKNYMSMKSGSTILGKDDYLQQDIYDQFLMGYTDDYQLAKTINTMLNDNTKDIPQSVKNKLKKLKNISVWEGGAIVSQSAANNLNSYRTQTKTIKDLSQFEGTDLVKKLKNLKVGDYLNGENVKFSKNTSIAGIKFSKNDILKGIRKTEKGYLVEYDKKENAQVGSKITGEYGNRNTIAAIVDDQVMDWLTKELGVEGAHILTQRADLKATNISEQIGGRINYIINSALKSATITETGKTDHGKLNDLHKSIDAALSQSGNQMLQDFYGRLFHKNDKTGLLDMMGIHDAHGYRYRTPDGIIKNLFKDGAEGKKERDYFFSGQFVSDLGNTIFKSMGLTYNPDLTAGAMGLTNLYELKDPIGGGSVDDIYATSKYKIGGRERAALESRLNFARHAYNQDFKELGTYLGNWAKPRGASYSEAEKLKESYNKAWNDNITLIKNKDKTKSLASRLGDVNEGNVFELLAEGAATNDHQIALSDIFTTESGDFIKGMDDEDFQRIIAGRIVNKIKEINGEDADIDNSKVILKLGKYAAELDDGRVLDELALALGVTETKDGNTITYSQGHQAMRDLLGNIYNADINGVNAQKYINSSVSEYLSMLKSPEDKNSTVFENLMTAKVGSSMSGHVHGVNLDHSKEWGDNTIGVSSDSIRKMLGGLSTKALENLYYGNFGEKILNEKSKEDIIKDFMTQMYAGKTLTGIAHRYPTTDSEALWFSDIRLDTKLKGNNMRFGLGLSTGVNADYDGDTGYLALPFTDLENASEEDVKKLFEQMNLVKKMNTDIGTMIGDWTRNSEKGKAEKLLNARLEERKKGNNVSLPSGKDVGEQISDSDIEGILTILSKHNFGYIGNFSNFATKYRTIAKNKGLNTRFDSDDEIKSLANNKIVAALFELTEQDAISAKKIGQRLSVGGAVDKSNIINGLSEYSSLLYNTKFASSRNKAEAIVQKAIDIGLISGDKDNEKMDGRQAIQAISNIQKIVAQKIGYGDDYYNEAVQNKLKEEYGLIANDGEGAGSISKETLISALTDIQDEFGGVKGFVNELNSAKAKELTGSYSSDKIAQVISREVGDIWKNNAVDNPENKIVENENTSGESGYFKNVTIESMKVGTIVAENGISEGKTSGEGLGKNAKTYISDKNGDLVSVKGKGDSSVLYNPEKKWDPNDITSLIEHTKYTDSVFKFLGMKKLTKDDIQEQNISVGLAKLNTIDGKHEYLSGGKPATYDIFASQLGAIADITTPNRVNFANDWFANVLKELLNNGFVNLKYKDSNGEYKEKKFNNLEDIYKTTNNSSWLTAARIARSTEMGSAMHKIMELTYGKDKLSIDDALNHDEVKTYKNHLFNLGMQGDITSEFRKSYEKFSKLLGSLGIQNGNLLTEQSHIIKYGNGDNALKIAGTFDAFYNQLLMDYKNEGTLNSPAHAMQLEILADMIKKAYGDLIKIDNNEIKKKILASFGADKNFDSAILDYGPMSDDMKLNLLNQIKANVAIGKYFNAQGFNPLMEDGVLTQLNGPSFSRNNYEKYQKLQLLLSNGKKGSEFNDSMSNLEFEKTNVKTLQDGLEEWTYSFFDEETKKQLNVSLVKSLTGAILSNKTKISEVDMSEDYDKLRKEYLQHLSQIDIFDARIREEEAKGENKNEDLIDQYTFGKFEAEKAIQNLRANTNSTVFNGLEVSREVKGLKLFSENTSEDADRGRNILNKLRNNYQLLTQEQQNFAYQKFNNFDKEDLEYTKNKIEAIKNTIQEATKALEEWNKTKMEGVTDDEKLAVMQMATAAKGAHEQDIAQYATSLYSPEEIKAFEKNYLEDMNRIASLNRDLFHAQNKKTYGKQDRERVNQQIVEIEKELAELSNRNVYDPKTGTLSVARRTIEGKAQVDEKGNVIRDSVLLSSDNKVGFERKLSEQNINNQQRYNDLVRDNQKLGVIGQFKATMGQALNHLVIGSLGYTVIGAVKQQFHKIIQLTASLDKTMTDLSIVTGKNKKEVNELMGSYNGLAKSIGLTTAEVSASANEWLRMGYRTDEITTLVKNSAMLAKLGMIDTGKATEYLTSAIKGYGVAVEDSSNIVDMATSLDMKYAVSAGYILEAMARTATSAKLAKVEMADLQAMIAVVGETSQKDASVIGESFKTAFSRYGNVKAGVFAGNSDMSTLSDQYKYENLKAELGEDINVNDIEKVLNKVGVRLRNGTDWNSYSDILERIGTNFKKMSDYEKNAITTAMFGTRQRENGLILLEKYNDVMEASKIANESAGTATAKYIQYQDSLEAATNRVTSAFEKMVLDIKGSDSIKSVLSVIANLLENIRITTVALVGAATITHLDKIINGLTIMSTKARSISFMSFLDFFKRKGDLRKYFDDALLKGYETLDNRNHEYVEKQMESFKKRKNGGETGVDDLVNKEIKGKTVTEEDKIKYRQTHADDLNKLIEGKEKNRQKKINTIKKESQKERQHAIKQLYKENSDLFNNKIIDDDILKKIEENRKKQSEKNRNYTPPKNVDIQEEYTRILNKESKQYEEKISDDEINKIKEESEKKKTELKQKFENNKEEEIKRVKDNLIKDKTPKSLNKAAEEYLNEIGAPQKGRNSKYSNSQMKEAKNKIRSKIESEANKEAIEQVDNSNRQKIEEEYNAYYNKRIEDLRQEKSLRQQAINKVKEEYSDFDTFDKTKQENLINKKHKQILDEKIKDDYVDQELKPYVDTNLIKKKQIAKANAINSVRGAVDLVVGAQVGSEIGQGISKYLGGDESTWQVIGSMIGMYAAPQLSSALGSMIGSSLGPVGQSFISAGITAAVSIGLAVWNKVKKDSEKRAKEIADNVEKSREKISSYSNVDTKDKFERYDELVKGVNKYGQNVSLSESEFKEFQDIGNELGESFDNLVVGFDVDGNKLLGTAVGRLGNLTKTTKELIETEKKRMYAENTKVEKGMGKSPIEEGYNKLKDNIDKINKSDEYKWGRGEFAKADLRLGLNHNNYKYKNHPDEFKGNLFNGYTSVSAKGLNSLFDKYDNIIEKYVNLSDNYDYDMFEVISKNIDGKLRVTGKAGKIQSEDAEAFAKEIEVATDDFFKIQTEAYKQAVKKAKREFTQEFLPSILGKNEIFNSLSSDVQSFINAIGQNIDPTQFGNPEKYMEFIEKNLIAPLSKKSGEVLLSSLQTQQEKKQKGVELTLAEDIEEKQVIKNSVKNIYGSNSKIFKNTAEELGYSQEKNKDGKKIWKDKNGKKIESKDIQARVYNELSGNDGTTENLINDISTLFKKKKNDSLDVLKKNLTIEEARYIFNNKYKYEGMNANEIVAAVQKERLTSVSTLKDRIQDVIKESDKSIDSFENLLESGKTIDEISKELFGGEMPDNLRNYLESLNNWANLLGISLDSVYNKAKNLSALDRNGFTTKSVQQIVEEEGTMREIQNAISGGTVSAEQLTYLYSKDPNYAFYSDFTLADKIGKESAYNELLMGSIGNTLSYSDELMTEAMKKSGVFGTKMGAYSNKKEKFLQGSNEGYIKNYKDLLDYEYYFGDAKTAADIEKIKKNNKEAKEWAEEKNLVGAKGSGFKGHSNVQILAAGAMINKVKDQAQTLFKQKVIDNMTQLADSQIRSANRAHKELLKNIADIDKQLTDLGKNKALNKLQKEIDELRLSYQKFDKELSLYDWGFDYLAKGDYLGKDDILGDKLIALTEKNKALSDAMDLVNSKTPKTAEEANLLKEEYDNLSNSYIENQKALLELNNKREALGVTMLSEAVTESISAMNKQMKVTSDYMTMGNSDTYIGGAEQLLGYDLSGTFKSKNEVDRKQDEYKKLIDMQKEFNKKSIELNKKYLDLKAQQDEKDLKRQKENLEDERLGALINFYNEYGGVMLAHGIKREEIGLDDNAFARYYGNSLISEGKRNEVIQSIIDSSDTLANEQYQQWLEEQKKKAEENKNKNKNKNKNSNNNSNSNENKDNGGTVTAPNISGTNVSVDNPDTVSEFITNTMQSGINSANDAITNNSSTYAIKAPKLDENTWGSNGDSSKKGKVTKGLGLRFKKAYVSAIKALNSYIETTTKESEKLDSPQLNWKGKRGWGADNNKNDSLLSRMKNRVKACIKALNEYISDSSDVGKLIAPEVDQKSWEMFGITIGKYINNGIEFAVQEGIENDLDKLFEEYKKSKKTSVANDKGDTENQKKTSGKLGLSNLFNMGTTPIGSNNIPVGAAVYMTSKTSPNEGHVGIMGSDGNIWHWTGRNVKHEAMTSLAAKGYVPYAWGWHGGTPLTAEEANKIDNLLRKENGQGCGKSQCQKWVGLTYANALGTSYIASGGSANTAAAKWGTNKIGSIDNVKTNNINNPFFTWSYAQGTNSHKGGLALIGDEGLINNKTGQYPELVVLPNGNIQIMGLNGPTLTNLPKGSQVLSNKDTNNVLRSGVKIKNYATGTPMSNAKYLNEIINACKEFNIPLNIALSLIDQESANGTAADTWKENFAGAVGLTQLTQTAIDDLAQDTAVSKDVVNKLTKNKVDYTKARVTDESAYRDNIWTGIANLRLIKDRYFNGTNAGRGTDIDWSKTLGWYYAGGNWNSESGKTYANQVLQRADTEAFKKALNDNTSSILDNTKAVDNNTQEEKKQLTADDYQQNFQEQIKDLFVGDDDKRLYNLVEQNLEKIPTLRKYDNLIKNTYDPIVRASYQVYRNLYETQDNIKNYNDSLAEDRKKLNEAQYNMGLAKQQGKSKEIIEAWKNIVESYQEEVKNAQSQLDSAFNEIIQIFTDFADKLNKNYSTIKEDLDANYDFGRIGRKTNENYYDILRVNSDDLVKNLEQNYRRAIQEAVDSYKAIGFSDDIAYAKAMEKDSIQELKKGLNTAINDRKQIETDQNNELVDFYTSENERIQTRLGYNSSNLLDYQLNNVYNDTMKNIESMISDNRRYLDETKNLSPAERQAKIDTINKDIYSLISKTSDHINTVLDRNTRINENAITQREKELSAGGIRYNKSIYYNNIKNLKDEGDAIAQAIADLRYNLRKEAIFNGLTNETDINEYINKNSELVSLNEKYLDTLKNISDENKNILDFTTERVDNEKKLLDLSKESEWASISNIESYYDSNERFIEQKIRALKTYIRSNNLSEQAYNEAKMQLAELEKEKFSNDLQMMQDKQSYYNKQYEAMKYMVNEYITALNEEKENISDTYDEEIDKLEKVNNTKERLIKLTELQNNLYNAQNEKKRVYRAGVGFVYEQDRDAIKKAKDEIKSFYQQDQIDNLNKAKEMESKILDDRIKKWQKYLDGIEKVYKTAERNKNINILEGLFGTEGWHGIFNELNSDMETFVQNYDNDIKIYSGWWDNFLHNYERLSTNIYNKLEESVDLLNDIPKFKTSDIEVPDKSVSEEIKNQKYDSNYYNPEIKSQYGSWKDFRYIRDFQKVAESESLQKEYNMSKDEANYYHEQKWAELFDFYTKNKDLVENIILGKSENTTQYRNTELIDAVYTGIKRSLDDNIITNEAFSQKMDLLKLASEDMKLKDYVPENKNVLPWLAKYGHSTEEMMNDHSSTMTDEDFQKKWTFDRNTALYYANIKNAIINKAYAESRTREEFLETLKKYFSSYEDFSALGNTFDENRTTLLEAMKNIDDSISEVQQNSDLAVRKVLKNEDGSSQLLMAVNNDVLLNNLNAIKTNKKKKAIENLLNNNTDIQAIINKQNAKNPTETWTDEETGLTKDELVEARVYKLWRKFIDSEELKIYNNDGSYNHEQSLNKLISMIEPSLEENYNLSATGPIGNFIDLVEDYVHQSKSDYNTTIEDISKAADDWQKAEKDANKVDLIGRSIGYPVVEKDNNNSNANNVVSMNNFFVTKDDHGVSKIPEIIGQQAAINNHAK